MTREFEARGGPIIFMNQKRIRLSPEVAAVCDQGNYEKGEVRGCAANISCMTSQPGPPAC